MRKQIMEQLWLAPAVACSPVWTTAQVQEKLPQQPTTRQHEEESRGKKLLDEGSKGYFWLRWKIPVQKEAERNIFSSLTT